MPPSDALQLIERFRLRDPATLEERITVQDPKTFAQPWDAVVSYRQPGARIAEDICLERLQITLHTPGTT